MSTTCYHVQATLVGADGEGWTHNTCYRTGERQADGSVILAYNIDWLEEEAEREAAEQGATLLYVEIFTTEEK